MTDPAHVALLGYGAEPARQVGRACRTDPELEFLGATGSPPRLLGYSPPPDVVLVGGEVTDADGLRFVEEAAMLLPLASIILLAGQDRMDLVQQALLAGARGFLLGPYGDTELQNTIRRIHRLESEKRSHLADGAKEPTGSRQGRILAVFSPKGGVGRTAVSTNLAIALQQMRRQVVLVDGSLQFGDVPVALNILDSHATIASLVRILEEIDSEYLMEALTLHSSGIYVLPAPAHLEDANAVYPEALEQILAVLQKRFDYVVVDACQFLDETNLAVLDVADRVLLIATPELPALQEVRLFLELADARGYSPDKLMFILNRATSVFGLGTAEIEEHMRYRIAISIPSDGPLVTRSLNRGVPVIISNPNSAVALSIKQLAELVADRDNARGNGAGPGGFSGRLRGLLKT